MTAAGAITHPEADRFHYHGKNNSPAAPGYGEPVEQERPSHLTVTADYANLSFAELVIKAATLAEILNPSRNAQPTSLELMLARFWLEGVGFELQKRSPTTSEEARQRKRILSFIAATFEESSPRDTGASQPMSNTTSLPGSTSCPTTSEGCRQHPPAGLHLVTPRLLYEHHGLSLDGGWVIHRTGPGDAITDGTVCVVTLDEFADGKSWRIQPHRSRRYSPSESIERGRSREGEVAYNVALNNCEHFVNWCIEGEYRSDQVQRVLTGATVVAQTALDSVKSPSRLPVRMPTFGPAAPTLHPVPPHMLGKMGDSLLPKVLESVTRTLPPVAFVVGAVEAASRLFDFLSGE